MCGTSTYGHSDKWIDKEYFIFYMFLTVLILSTSRNLSMYSHLMLDKMRILSITVDHVLGGILCMARFDTIRV